VVGAVADGAGAGPIASLLVREEERPDEVAGREFKARALALLTELGQ